MKSIKRYYSRISFPTPSFWIGFGSIFNLTGDYFSFTISKVEQQSDINAIKSDWEAVGKDLNNSITQYKNTIN
jgi:hypothetical protein